MSGHSKWSTIKRKKEKTDNQRAKIFTKIGRELSVAVRDGGGADPNVNTRLKDCIAKAKANNVPNENIERIIKKAAGEGNTNHYETIRYEGYGPGGIAVIVDTLTDNRNRTAGDIRHYFDKFGGNLGTPGCVSFLFSEMGVIVVEKDSRDKEQVMEDAIECGATDFSEEEDIIIIYTDSSDLQTVRDQLTQKGYHDISAELEMVPLTQTTLSDEEQRIKMQRLLDLLEDHDDVQNTWNNWDLGS